METVCNKIEDCKIEVKVNYGKEEWAKVQEEVLANIAKDARIDGFRKGRVPTKMIRARVGEQVILQDAFDRVLNRSYDDIIKNNNIEPAAKPEVKVETMTAETLEFSVVVTIAPTFELGQYKGLEVKKTAVKVTKKEIEEEIERYRNQFAELVIKDGAVEDGDTAVIDFDGYKDGEQFEGGKAENHSLVIGSHSFIEGFEEQVIGMVAGEEKEINVTFPEDYHVTDLAGQPVVFKVKLHEVKTKVLPEVDDELAKDININGIETLEDLQVYVKEQIKNRKDRESEEKFNDELFGKVIENTPFDLPEEIIETEIDYMMKEIEQSLSQQGATLELYQQITGKTPESMREEMKEQANQRVRFNLIIDAIAKAEGFEITAEDIEEEYGHLANSYNTSVEDIKDYFVGRDEQIKKDICQRKAIQLIKDSVK